MDDAGSSRLFQPHRTLGLLTSSSSHQSTHHHNRTSRSDGGTTSPNPHTHNLGKFHLQPLGKSSEDSFLTVPLGDRFQILNCDKLVPVLVGRCLPGSAGRYLHSSGRSSGKGHSSDGGGGGDSSAADGGGGNLSGANKEEEMHQVISDSSLSITVATHGPKMLRRAVSISLYIRARPMVCLDAFPFAGGGNSKHGSERKRGKWGIVDIISLGKQKVEMGGEKEGMIENSLLLALVCARDDSRKKSEKKKDDEGVQVVGRDSDESESGEEESSDSDSESGSDSDSASSLEDKDIAPPSDCYGRILLVRATRTTMEIIKTIDLSGIGSNFVPFVGIHPATYVNKILLGGRPAAAASKKTSLLLVNIKSGKMIHSFTCLDKLNKKHQQEKDTHDGPTTITALEQSPAVDTIAVGTSKGSVHLINTLHDVKLFTLHHKAKHSNATASISSLSFRTDGNATRQGIAPLAVGSNDGYISIWDLSPSKDGTKTLLTQMHVHYGGVSKSQYLPGEPLLLSTGYISNSITMHVFDAPDHSGRVLRQRKGHSSPPTLVRYLHSNFSVLPSSSDGTDASSCQILSCGGKDDQTLRIFSTARSNLDREYSQGSGLERKVLKYSGNPYSPAGRAELLLPEIIGLASTPTRSRDWGDLVTIHKNHAMAYVWSTKRGAQSGPVLRQPHWNVSAMKIRPDRKENATSLAISGCGNFALIGTQGGVIYKYNLQSGLGRGSFPKDAVGRSEEDERRRKRGLKTAGDVGRSMKMLEKNLIKGGIAAGDVDQAERDRMVFMEVEAKRKEAVGRATHVDAVVGIAIDSLNKTVVSAGADSKIVLWNFVTHMPHKKSPILLPSPATKMCHVRDSDLAAIAMNDFGVVVFDCSSLSIVRYFGGGLGQSSLAKDRIGHTGLISDLGFGPDGRKLFTSSMDGSIRVWDVPTGLCVDWMTFSSPPTSLTLSPTGEFLATSHVGQLGISLWCDKSFFRMVHLDGTPTEPAKMNEPCPVAECEQEGASEAVMQSALASSLKKDIVMSVDGQSTVDGADSAEDIPPNAKDDGLITLSGLPPAHWKNLFHLELVKERNKPTEAPQKPPQAPFFLQWRAGLDSSAGDGNGLAGTAMEDDNIESKKEAPDGWDAVWSDDEEDDESNNETGDATEVKSHKNDSQNKRRKVVHERTQLAGLLRSCSPSGSYSEVTKYLATMGPSSIDVELSSLCYGSHDIDEGLPLLHLASKWLLEACKSHESFEAVNAYLHRFLHVHGNVITTIEKSESNEGGTGIENDLKLGEFKETISQLRGEQRAASNRLQGKMQHTICLLRHLSRMV